MIALPLIFVLAYSLSRYSDMSWLSATRGCEWWRLLTYSMVHLSFLHMITNAFMLLVYYPLVKLRYGSYTTIMVVIPSLLLSTALSLEDKPTYGASGIVFSLFGMYLASLWRDRIEGRTRYTVTLLLMMAFQSVIGFNVVNWKLHIFSLIISFLLCVILRK